jgi:hypothetical protein
VDDDGIALHLVPTVGYAGGGRPCV